MDWKEYIIGLNTQPDVGYQFQYKVLKDDIQLLKSAFDINELPFELEELLMQANGVHSMLYVEKLKELIINDWLVYSVEKIIETNKFQRKNCVEYNMSFNQLLFFAPAGNGDLFGYVMIDGYPISKRIFVWNHEDDSRVCIADDLKTFLNGWISGQLTI